MGEPSTGVFAVAYAVVMLVSMIVAYLVTGSVRDVGLVGVMAILCFPIAGAIALLLGMVFVRTLSWLKMDRDFSARVSQYRSAVITYDAAVAEANRERQAAIRERERLEREAEWERQRIAERQRLAEEEQWASLSGAEFERALGNLLQGLGYGVVQTGGTGDEGIDLLVRRGNRTTVVQCKRYKSPAGPAVARELYGAMVAYGADHALLACTGGFTQGATDFARNKPITLWSLDDLVHWAGVWNRRESTGG